jgi:hypothetical protein
VKWKTILGNNDSVYAGRPQTGVENYGAPVITAGGLLFIVTKDGMFRALIKGRANYYGNKTASCRIRDAGSL